MTTPTLMDAYRNDTAHGHLAEMLGKSEIAQGFLKNASFNPDRVQSLPDTAFAWEAERLLPLDTKEDAVASLLYRAKLASTDVPAEVDAKLAHAVVLYDLLPLMRDLAVVKEAAARPEDAAPSKYALPEEGLLPIDTVEQIKVAEATLCEQVEKFPHVKHAQAVARVVVAAYRHGMPLSKLTHRYFGATATNTKKLAYDLEMRATAAGEGPVREGYDKLAAELRCGPQYLSDRDTQLKIASTVLELDQAGKLEYDKRFESPMLTVCNTTKTAEEMVDLGGVSAPLEAVMQLPTDVWEEMDVPEMAPLVEAGDADSVKQVLDTLPLDLKVQLQPYVS